MIKMGVINLSDDEVPYWYEHPDKCRKCGVSLINIAHFHDIPNDETSPAICIDCYAEKLREEIEKEVEEVKP